MVSASHPPPVPHFSLVYSRYLDAHVLGGYQFLMQNYVVGDKICIFGKHCQFGSMRAAV